MDDLFSVENKIIIVTGGAKGIGREISEQLVKRGGIVFCLDISFKKTSSHKHLYYKKCDITNSSEFKTICKSIYEKFKKIDVLINNAGITLPSTSLIYPDKNWSKTIEVNLTGAF